MCGISIRLSQGIRRFTCRSLWQAGGYALRQGCGGPPWPSLACSASASLCTAHSSPCASLLPSPSLQYLPVPYSGVRSVRCCEMSHRDLLGHPCSAALPDSPPTLSVFCSSVGSSYLWEPCLPPSPIQQFSPVSSKTERKGRRAENIIV